MLDNVCLLFEDVARLPIITSPPQEMWLGIQLKAPEHLALPGEETGLGMAESASAVLAAAYERMLVYQVGLEDGCATAGVQLPKIETWAAELLSARWNIYQLRRSRLRRFIRTVAKIEDEPLKDELLDHAYNVAELLCLFPNKALNHVIEFGQAFERLPTPDEMTITWLKETTLPRSVQQVARRRAKRARDTLVTGYLRYALRIARSYVERGLEYNDLAQAGFVGLIKAADRFDYRKQTRFGSYATSWIWQNITRTIADQSRTIRVPVHLHDQIHKLEEICKRLVEDGNDCPTVEDILFQTDILSDDNLETVQRCREQGISLPDSVLARYKGAIWKIQGLVNYTQLTLPLDLTLPAPLAELARDPRREETTLAENIPEEDSPALADVVDQSLLQDAIRQALQVLKPRQREILRLKFGLVNGDEHTLEEVGQAFGVTRERIRQIEKQSLEKLGRSVRSRVLRAHLDSSCGEQTVYLPQWILAYLDDEFNYWTRPEAEEEDWRWLNELLEGLPGSDWHRAQSRDREIRQSQLEDVLRALSAPAHYSVIAERTNVLLPPDRQTSAQNIRNMLDQEADVFIHLGQGIYWLRSYLQEESSTQPPADLLFGAQLARWQTEWDGRPGGSEFDTHAEVDIIRQVGLDFFAD